MLAPASQLEVAVAGEFAEVAGRERAASYRLAAEVAEKGARRDLHFALGQRDLDMAERAADLVAVVTGPVEADYRAAFGQAVALVGRQAERTSAGQQRGIDAGAADGDETQALRGALAGEALLAGRLSVTFIWNS